MRKTSAIIDEIIEVFTRSEAVFSGDSSQGAQEFSENMSKLVELRIELCLNIGQALAYIFVLQVYMCLFIRQESNLC